MMNLKILVLLLSLLCFKALAQNVTALDSLKKENKGNNVVILKDFDKITIDIKDEKLLIKRELFKRHFYTNNKAQFYSKEKVNESTFKKIVKIEAFTEQKHKGKYKKVKTKLFEENNYLDHQVFFQDIKSYDFNFQGLSEDAISNLSYEYNITEPRLLNGTFFQSVFPMEDKEFIIDVDRHIEMGFVKFNFDSTALDSSVEKTKNRIIYTFKAKKIKELDLGDNPPPIRFIIPHLVPYIKSYRTKINTYNVLRNTDDLYHWYSSLVQNMDCKAPSLLAEKANEISSNYISELEKTKAIFNWVQQNIKYIAIEVGIGGFVPDCASKVFENKYGDCKGMANILHEMLRSIGIKSYLTWIGTQDLPYVYKNTPTPLVDNHMILTYIDTTGSYFFLDATDEHVLFGFPSAFIQGKEALIGKGEKYEIRKVPTIDANFNQQRDSIHMKIVKNEIIAKGNITFSGYEFTRIRNRSSSIVNDKKMKKFINNYIERGNNKFLVQKTKQTINLDKGTVNHKYDFTIGNYLIRNENKIFINLNIFKSMLIDKIKDDRDYPMIFRNKNSYKYYVKLEIPDGFEIEHFPKNEDYDDQLYKLNIKYTQLDSNALVYELYVHYNTLQLNQPDFVKYNMLNEKISQNFREVVVLKKSN